MNIKKLIIAFGATAIMSLSAHAGLFVEPSVTYEKSETSVNYPSPFSNSTGNVDGLGVGMRLGFHFADIVFAGLDARYSMPQFKDSSVTYDAKAISTSLGPVIGVQMPVVGLRVWAGHILAGSLDPEASGNLNVKFEKPSGYRVGVGFQVILVSLNLEYQQVKYSDTTFESYGPFNSATPTSDVSLENKSWVASVSFPITL